MKASETHFQIIIEGAKQYVVPLFQRPYKWDKPEWNTLWDDLLELIENEDLRNHFIGSIVTIPTVSVPEGIAKYLLIDGQQRLTTIFILLSLLRDLSKSIEENELSEEITHTMLVNPYKKGSDYFKLLPTQVDRDIFKNLIKESHLPTESQISKCYEFFDAKLKRNKIDIKLLYTVIISRLSVVSIVLDPDDNPHVVFESLNAKGRPLTQSDLIRNYFFMRIHAKDQDECYSKYWFPMQEILKDSLTDFVRHYIMSSGKIVRQNEIYFILKESIGDTDIINALVKLSKFASYYNNIINPEFEKNPGIRHALHRLNQIEVTTAYPFLLNCYDDYTSGKLIPGDFQKILHFVENFILRRFICNLPSAPVNKVFPILYRDAQLKGSSLVDGVRLILQQKGYPKDGEFIARLKDTKLYVGDRKTRTRLILESLECTYEHKEPVSFSTSSISIEHIMPQNISNNSWWQTHLGEDWETTHELYLHTLGNLTLTGYNSELSNADFKTKKKQLNDSHLEINKYFRNVNSWTKDDIDKRSESLASLALIAWPYFGDAYIGNNSSEVTGKRPTKLQFIDMTITPKSWIEVLTHTLNKIHEIEPDGFAKLIEDYPRLISKEPTHFRRTTQLKSGYYVEKNLAAKNIHRFCLQAIESVGISSEEWILTVEE